MYRFRGTEHIKTTNKNYDEINADGEVDNSNTIVMVFHVPVPYFSVLHFQSPLVSCRKQGGKKMDRD